LAVSGFCVADGERGLDGLVGGGIMPMTLPGPL
jgi:hypothetical protein